MKGLIEAPASES